MTDVTRLHQAVAAGDMPTLHALLETDRTLVNAVSETDARGTYPLHVAAEFGQAEAARVLLEYGADVTRLDAENAAIALGWAAFFGRPAVIEVLLTAGSEASQRNRHGLTPLGCAVGGAAGRWTACCARKVRSSSRQVNSERVRRAIARNAEKCPRRRAPRPLSKREADR